MRIRTVKNVVMGLAIVLAAAAPAAAQANVGVGLSFLHDTSVTGAGLAFDVAKDVIKSTEKVGVGVVGDLGFNKFDGCTESSFGGGVRVTGKSAPTFKPFGQFVIGGAKCGSGGTGVMYQPGFGVDIKLNDTLSARVQVDIRNVHNDGFSFTEQRFWFGVSLPVGKK